MLAAGKMHASSPKGYLPDMHQRLEKQIKTNVVHMSVPRGVKLEGSVCVRRPNEE